MDTITKDNIHDYMVNGTWSVDGSMKPDKESDSDEQIRFTLNVKYNNVPVIDIVNKSLEPTKISWVNGQGRPNITKWTNGQVIDIDFKSPAKAIVDHEAVVRSRAKTLHGDERIKYLAGLAGMSIEEFKASMK